MGLSFFTLRFDPTAPAHHYPRMESLDCTPGSVDEHPYSGLANAPLPCRPLRGSACLLLKLYYFPCLKPIRGSELCDNLSSRTIPFLARG
jgi:hypothetical protein